MLGSISVSSLTTPQRLRKYLAALRLPFNKSIKNILVSNNVQDAIDEVTDLARLDYMFEAAKGNIEGASIIQKFGHSDSIGTTLAVVSEGNIYQTPTTATALEIVSSDANDTDGGSGAQTVTVYGLGADWKEQSETVTMNGTTAVALTKSYTRIFRAYVTTSGTYATATAGSHAGEITIRTSGAGASWALIKVNGLALGQTEIGVYTIPKGKTGYLVSLHAHVETNKQVDIYGFIRDNADDVVSPYSGALRVFYQAHGVTEDEDLSPRSALGGFVGPCDIGFMAEVTTGTAGVGIEFELVLIDN